MKVSESKYQSRHLGALGIVKWDLNDPSKDEVAMVIGAVSTTYLLPVLLADGTVAYIFPIWLSTLTFEGL